MTEEFNDSQYLWYPKPHWHHPFWRHDFQNLSFALYGSYDATVFNTSDVHIAVVFPIRNKIVSDEIEDR